MPKKIAYAVPGTVLCTFLHLFCGLMLVTLFFRLFRKTWSGRWFLVLEIGTVYLRSRGHEALGLVLSIFSPITGKKVNTCDIQNRCDHEK